MQSVTSSVSASTFLASDEETNVTCKCEKCDTKYNITQKQKIIDVMERRLLKSETKILPSLEKQIILNVQKFPCLYDRTNKCFVNRVKREKAWRAIADTVGISDKYCKERWRSLRDRYVKELRAEISQNIKSQWMYFDLFSFLRSMSATKRLDILVEKLIEVVKQHTCIYDRANIYYRNKVVKAKTWNEVAAAVGVDARRCQLRWRSLRDRFVREFNKKSETNNGTPRWKYFNLLSFLKEHTSTRKPYVGDDWEWDEDPTGTSHLDLSSSRNAPGWASENSCSSSDEHIDIKPDLLPKSEMDADPLSVEEDYLEHIEEIHRPETPVMEPSPSRNVEKPSRNVDFLKVLDSYLVQLPDRIQDSLKMEFLNAVYRKIQENDNPY